MRPWWQHSQLVKVAIGALWHHYHGQENESPEADMWLLASGWIMPGPNCGFLITSRGKNFMESFRSGPLAVTKNRNPKQLEAKL